MHLEFDLFIAMHNEDFRKNIGVRLKDLRKQKRWSQKELAAKVDIRFQQLNKYASGLNTPPAEMLVKLADTLGTTVDYLLTGNLVEDNPLGNTRLFQRIRAVEHFEPEDQEAIIKLIDAMIAKQRREAALTPVDKQAMG
jgi:transcriptional regulator with XRE-family HTH domain